MMQLDSPLSGQLHGKTGSCLGDPDHGWFVGWVDWSQEATTWFVVNISGNNAWGGAAKAAALELLPEFQP
jgi:beta-lactamase class D